VWSISSSHSSIFWPLYEHSMSQFRELAIVLAVFLVPYPVLELNKVLFGQGVSPFGLVCLTVCRSWTADELIEEMRTRRTEPLPIKDVPAFLLFQVPLYIYTLMYRYIAECLHWSREEQAKSYKYAIWKIMQQ